MMEVLMMMEVLKICAFVQCVRCRFAVLLIRVSIITLQHDLILYDNALKQPKLVVCFTKTTVTIK